MPRPKIKKKPGAKKKELLQKTKRCNYSMDRTVLALLEHCKAYGFKNKSAMVNAGVISIARQKQADVFESNLLQDKNGLA